MKYPLTSCTHSSRTKPIHVPKMQLSPTNTASTLEYSGTRIRNKIVHISSWPVPRENHLQSKFPPDVPIYDPQIPQEKLRPITFTIQSLGSNEHLILHTYSPLSPGSLRAETTRNRLWYHLWQFSGSHHKVPISLPPARGHPLRRVSLRDSSRTRGSGLFQ